MAEKAQIDRSSPHSLRLGQFLRTKAERILREWSSRVRAAPDAAALPESVLRDHLPQILASLACSLEDEGPGSGEATYYPDIHALTRLDAGFDLQQVAAEYAVLRRSVLDLWVAEVGDLVSAREVTAFDEAIDEAICAAVSRYASARERTLRALDGISNAALNGDGPADFMQRFLVGLQETTPAVDSAAIYVVEGEDLVIRAAVGPAHEGALERRVRRGECIAGRTALAGAPFESVDTRVDPRITSDTIDKDKLRAAYAVPLVIGGEVAAVVVVGSETARALSEEDKLLVRTLAARAAAILALRESMSELRRAQAALQESEQRLRLVIDGVPHLINFVDAEQRYRLNNKAYEDWFGVPRDALQGKPVAEVVGEENYRVLAPTFARVLGGETMKIELPFVFQGGRRGFIEAIFVPQVTTEGRVLGYVSLVTDISERKGREASDKSRLDFEQQLIGIVSHDLRNPLHAITIGATLLLRREDLDERATKTAARILSSAERATRLIRDLLDFTAARLGKGIPIAPREVDLHALVAGVLEEVRLAFPDREFRAEHEGEGLGVIDHDRIAQVITNITSNAVQYSPPATPVTVRTVGTGDGLVLSVHNCGPAIPAEIRPHLFAPLQRGHGPDDPRFRSVGLGLYIVRSIVEAHGGRIEVQSTDAAGTTFIVSLPRRPPEGASPAK